MEVYLTSSERGAPAFTDRSASARRLAGPRSAASSQQMSSSVCKAADGAAEDFSELTPAAAAAVAARNTSAELRSRKWAVVGGRGAQWWGEWMRACVR